jgi:hypothetical protein
VEVFQSELIDRTWTKALPSNSSAHWVLAFGNREFIKDRQVLNQLQTAFPHADIVGCTTSGEIQGAQLFDHSLCITAIKFESSCIFCASANIKDYPNSNALSAALVAQLPINELRHVFVLADGQLINGSALVNSLSQYLPTYVAITGGLAGDGTAFKETQIWHNQTIASGLVAICGIYGNQIRIGHGHLGGWKVFGPERKVTRSEANILYEIDGRPALELYKEYLGEFSNQLPASALLFPLAVTQAGTNEPVVRTILSIDEAEQTMCFAGDVPEGSSCQLMRSNYENLVEGANGAAIQALSSCANIKPELAILISCVGRRLVLAQRTEEELEVVAEEVHHCPMTGFYSYGEISPLLELGRCDLHNQTMTITLFSEQK